MLKIIQLSDCHVSADPNVLYRGMSPRVELEGLLLEVKKWRPDLLLVTGDLAEDGSKEAYQYLAETLAALNVPVLTIPGNHDRAELQKKHFPKTAVDQALVYDQDGWRLIFLNSAKPGDIAGSFSDADLNGLEIALGSNKLPTVVVLHHQPVLTGSTWIDRFPLKHPEPFWSCLETSKNTKAVLWGHIHHEFSGKRDGICLLGTPSTVANSLPGCEKFTLDRTGPACRWLKLGQKGAFETGIMKTGNQAR